MGPNLKWNRGQGGFSYACLATAALSRPLHSRHENRTDHFDGWGHGNPMSTTPSTAKTPCADDMNARVPHASCGQTASMWPSTRPNGNSEVGHMNIGAGRVVYQDLCASTGAAR